MSARKIQNKGGEGVWHFQIYLDGLRKKRPNRRQPVELRVEQEMIRNRNRQPAAVPVELGINNRVL